MNYILENPLITLTIASKGAEIISLKNRDNVEFIWQAAPEVWGRHAPVLFPIVGKLKDNTYFYKEKSYMLPQHGFARDKEFECILKEKEKISFRLKDDAETLQNYPFSFELITTYTLNGNKVSVHHQIKNTGKDEMYFSIGAHPGFTCPLVEGTDFEDYFLEFNQTETFRRHKIKDSLFSGEQQELAQNTSIIPLTKDLFREDALVFKSLKSTSISLKNKKNDHRLSLDFTGFPYLGIWTKLHEKANFLCLEPWLGLADSQKSSQDLTGKEGIIKLNQNEDYTCEYAISIG